jgi:D-sedoheptulose 7-phosphate isomerase
MAAPRLAWPVQCVDHMPTGAQLQNSSRIDAPFNISAYLTQYMNVLARLDTAAVDRMADVLVGAWEGGRTVFCCGNGGSAASASHFTADLTKLTAPVRGPRLRAMALNESLAAISAISNDISYEEIFAEQLRAFLAPGDVVIGFSTSGSSPNVLRGLQYANTAGAITLGVTGCHGAKLEKLAQFPLVIDSASVQHIEDATMVVGHLLCLRVKELIARECCDNAQDNESLVRRPRAAGSIAAV